MAQENNNVEMGTLCKQNGKFRSASCNGKSGVPPRVGQRAPFATSFMVGREGKRTNNKTMLVKNKPAEGL